MSEKTLAERWWDTFDGVVDESIGLYCPGEVAEHVAATRALIAEGWRGGVNWHAINETTPCKQDELDCAMDILPDRTEP